MVNRLGSVLPGADQSALNKARVMSVLSGKGGVGKSIIAFNLAYQMASLGRRVLLVDADVSAGNLHVLANVPCECGVEQFASGRLPLQKATWRANDLLDILAAPDARPIPQLQEAAGAAGLIQRLREQGSAYDFIVLDHSSGVSNRATVMAHASDLNLLIVVPELTSIADAYGLYKYLVQANENIDCRLLLNRVQSGEEANFVHRKFCAVAERFLGPAPAFLGFIAEDPAVSAALAAQKPISAQDSDSPAAQSLAALGRVIVSASVPSAAAEVTQTVNNATTVADIKG